MGLWVGECAGLKDLQDITIMAAWPRVSSEPPLRHSKPEVLWPNSLRCFPVALLKHALILALKTPEMKVEEWLRGIHWWVGLH